MRHLWIGHNRCRDSLGQFIIHKILSLNPLHPPATWTLTLAHHNQFFDSAIIYENMRAHIFPVQYSGED